MKCTKQQYYFKGWPVSLFLRQIPSAFKGLCHVSHVCPEKAMANLSTDNLMALSVQPKIPEISARNQMERTISVQCEYLGPPLKVVLFYQSGHFSFDEIVVPSTAHLYYAYKNNNQTRGGLCLSRVYRNAPLFGLLEFPEFLLNGKRPKRQKSGV